jgi:hypothetical protein
MGVAYFIVLDRKNPGFDTAVDGKAVARESKAPRKDHPETQPAQHHDLTSFAALAAEFDVDPDLPSAQEKWFEAAEGLRWVRAVCESILTHPRSVKNLAALLADLQRFEEVLANAQRAGAKWHFEMDV